MARVQKNFRAEDMRGGTSEPAPAPKAEEQTPVQAPETHEDEAPKKAPAKRGPKSTKPKADVDPKESAPVVDGSADATHKE